VERTRLNHGPSRPGRSNNGQQREVEHVPHVIFHSRAMRMDVTPGPVCFFSTPNEFLPTARQRSFAGAVDAAVGSMEVPSPSRSTNAHRDSQSERGFE
jgi:hypothetical protein